MIKTNEFQNEKELYYTIGKNIKYYRKLYSLNKKELTRTGVCVVMNLQPLENMIK